MTSERENNYKFILRKIKSSLGLLICLFIFLSWQIALYIILYGSFFMKCLLIFQMTYQYFFCNEKNKVFIRFLYWLKPQDFFRHYEIIFEESINLTKSLIGFHPHCLICIGAGLSQFESETLKDQVICASRALIYLPISGMLATWFGVKSIHPKNFDELMRKGINISIMPGGFEESTLTNSSKDRIFIKSRKGFIMFALKHGYKVHPAYNFGENKAYYTLNILEGLRLKLNKLKMPGVFALGKYFLLPRDDIEIHCVIGKGIQLPKINNPTKKEIDEYHSLYINELKKLYNKYKVKFNSSKELEIF